MDNNASASRLIEHGNKLLNAPKEFALFTDNEEANVILNNLEEYPHAFVLACIMDQRIKAERAWLIPYHFKQRLGSFSFDKLKSLSQSKTMKLMSKPTALHIYCNKMSDYFYSAIKLIANKYRDNAALIWNNKPSSSDVVSRFLEFRGAGPKIANMATNILVRRFKIKLSDYRAIDISADVHVDRVFKRLGLIQQDASKEQLILQVRSISHEFPGLMDYPSWVIGKNWCRSNNPKCNECFMNDLCPKNL